MKLKFTSAFAVCMAMLLFFAQPSFSQNPLFWGMTTSGSVDTGGIIFKIRGDGNGFDTIYKFQDTSGNYPYGSLIRTTGGKLYGLTNGGGYYEEGVIFSFDPATYTYTDEYDFDGVDGSDAEGSLIQASDGKLYGMSTQGGDSSLGNIFSFDPSNGDLIDLFHFNDTLGSYPYGNLVQASNGKIYGLASSGGVYTGGVLFGFSPSDISTFQVLHDFNTTGGDGNSPFGSLIQANDGKLYGLAASGGDMQIGVLFSIDTDGNNYKKLFDFDSIHGSAPEASLLQAENGKFYGMATFGGVNDLGVIFSFNLADSTMTKLYDFDVDAAGQPLGNLIQASDHKMYGMVTNDFNLGGSDYGSIFSIDSSGGAYLPLYVFNENTGPELYGDLIEMPVTTGIAQVIEKDFLIYPNPATNQLTIQTNDFQPQLISIYDINGRKVIEEKYTTQIDISSITAGIYFVEIKGAEAMARKKFVKL